MSFQEIFNTVASKVLYFRVKSESLPIPDEKESLAAGNIVYVMEYRSWTNLLVLAHECRKKGYPSPLSSLAPPSLKRWHSVYSVAVKAPFMAWLFKERKRSIMLSGMLETMQRHSEVDVVFIPVCVFWGRSVAKQKHWLAVLFADSWRMAGRTRKLFTILIHGRHTLVTFSSPIRFRDNVDTNLTREVNIDRIQHTLATRLNELRTATLGPDISHRRTLVKDLLQLPAVRSAIKERQDQDKLTEYRAMMLAQRYLYEIVADCTTITVQLLQRGLTAFWNRFYSGIKVQHGDELKKLAITHSLVYVPCHRSHIDYLLLSYVLHKDGLALPYIAAGKNLNLPIIGSILRGGGAFFIRRSFKDNRLYATLLFEYMANLITKGIPIEYFIEGGRSRTGRLLMPKPGLLAMTVRGFLKYRKKPVVFIPVHIGYEKMIEGKAYVAELLGSQKKNENLFSTIKSIFSIRGKFGGVTTNFGEPVYLEKILERNHTHWATETYDDNLRPDWLKNTVSALARTIAVEINRATSVSATNLVSVVLVASSGNYVDAQEAAAQIELYAALIKRMQYSSRITVTDLAGQAQIERVESFGLIKRRLHPLGDMIHTDKKTAAILNYYRNNILHLLALPSLLACAFVGRQSLERSAIDDTVSLVNPFFKSEMFVEWDDDALKRTIDCLLDFFVEQGLLIKHDAQSVYSRPRVGSLQYSQMLQLANVILPVLEMYFVVSTILNQNENKVLDIHALEELCFSTVQRFSLLHRQAAIDYFDKNLVTNFIDTLIQHGFLNDANNKLQSNDSLLVIDKGLRNLLSAQIRTSMLRMLKR